MATYNGHDYIAAFILTLALNFANYQWFQREKNYESLRSGFIYLACN
jgi:hypothetical protein